MGVCIRDEMLEDCILQKEKKEEHLSVAKNGWMWKCRAWASVSVRPKNGCWNS